MTQREIIDAIAALAKVVEANRGLMGSERTANLANDKIRELTPLLLGTTPITDDESIISDEYAKVFNNRTPVLKTNKKMPF